MKGDIALVVRRKIGASAEKLFEAWTEPRHLMAWWGPQPVTCSAAEVDLRVGGLYRITNLLPDGSTIAIHGEFRAIERPTKLVYTWRMDNDENEASLVTVRFEPHGDQTEVVIVHAQIPSHAARVSHEAGWTGCLHGLATYAPRL